MFGFHTRCLLKGIYLNKELLQLRNPGILKTNRYVNTGMKQYLHDLLVYNEKYLQPKMWNCCYNGFSAKNERKSSETVGGLRPMKRYLNEPNGVGKCSTLAG